MTDKQSVGRCAKCGRLVPRDTMQISVEVPELLRKDQPMTPIKDQLVWVCVPCIVETE